MSSSSAAVRHAGIHARATVQVHWQQLRLCQQQQRSAIQSAVMLTRLPVAAMVRQFRSLRSVQSHLQNLRRRKKQPQKETNRRSSQRQMPTLSPAPPLQQGPMAQQPRQRQMQLWRAPVQRLPSRNADRRTEREHRGDNSGCSGGSRRTGSRLAPWSQSQRCAIRIGCLAVRCSRASCFVCSCYLMCNPLVPRRCC